MSQQQRDFPSLMAEGIKIIEAAEKRGATLRLMGGVAVRFHTQNHLDLYERLGRAPGDLDFMGLRKESKTVEDTMKSLEYEPNQRVNAFHGFKRQIWYTKTNQIDVLLDSFEMNHVIEFKDRLKLDKPTITPTDLFLQKIQIVKINEKDVKDLFILLSEHEVGEEDKDKINLPYVSKILSEDWGFWHTTQMNLDKMVALLPDYPQLTEEEREAVTKKKEIIRKNLQSSPKSFRWKLRDRVGTRQQWYNEVEEVSR